MGKEDLVESSWESILNYSKTTAARPVGITDELGRRTRIVDKIVYRNVNHIFDGTVYRESLQGN
jgi:hypothetical protein